MRLGFRLFALSGVLTLVALSGADAGAGQLPGSCDGTWKQVKPLPGAQNLTLNDVFAVGSKDVWLVGASPDGPVAIHWNGDAWKRFPAPSGGDSQHASLTYVDGTS